MSKWIAFYDGTGKELAAYTVTGTFEGELKATKDLLAYEQGISPEEIIIKEEER